MKLPNYNIILASNSPRRKELLSGLDISYEIRILDDIDEDYPDDMELEQVAEYLAQKKASAYIGDITSNELLITADTIVLKDNKIYGKPSDKYDAKRMLNELSTGTHEVITGVCLTASHKQVSFSAITKVTFGDISQEEIEYYVDKYNPYDKAGSYGVQEWIGYIAVKNIEGSYYNVMGLPIYRVYEELNKF